MASSAQPLLAVDRTGRKSKCTDETIARYVEGVALYLPPAQAALYAGVHPRTVDLWLQRAASGHGGTFQRFAIARREAEAKRAAATMAGIAKAAVDPRHWRAKAWLAEHLGIVEPTAGTRGNEGAAAIADREAAIPLTEPARVVIDAEEVEADARDELELVRRRAANLRRRIAQAEQGGGSMAAVAALSRQLTAAEDRAFALAPRGERPDDPAKLDEARFVVELEAHADTMPEAHLAVFARVWLLRHRLVTTPDPDAARRGQLTDGEPEDTDGDTDPDA